MNLLWHIERHMKATGVPPARLGRDAARDPNLVRDLRRGRQVGPDLAGRVTTWMAAHAGDRA